MPHRVGTCFHTGHCHLELNLYRANFTRQCMTTCQELSGYRSLLDTTQMCFRCMLHTVQQTSVPLRVDGNDVRRGTSPFGVGAVVVVGPHKRARKKLVLFECLLLGSGQISTVKWHWAIYFHANAINTNSKPTGFTNTLIHSKCWWNRVYDRQIGPFFWSVWRSASNKVKRSDHSRWIHMTGGAEVWPNARSIIGGDTTELGEVHLVEPVLCELLRSKPNLTRQQKGKRREPEIVGRSRNEMLVYFNNFHLLKLLTI